MKSQKKLTVRVDAKCSDMCAMQLIEDGKRVGESDGYVPNWFPSPQELHFGDYISLVVDLETGQILNWKKPTKADLKETFKLA